MKNLLIAGANGSQNAPETHLLIPGAHEVVGAESNPALHHFNFTRLWIQPWVLDQSPTVEPLQDKGSRIEIRQCFIDGFTPFCLGCVASDRNTATAPGAFVESAQLENQIALGLRELLHLRKVLNSQIRDNGVVRHFRWINDPTHRKDLPQSPPVPVTQFAPPDFLQRVGPEKRRPHFLFKPWLKRTGKINRASSSSLPSSFATGNIGKVKELKEAMDSLVDEIDEVLEENAEEFVKNYVQRGGQ